jgi:hypothetical protein
METSAMPTPTHSLLVAKCLLKLSVKPLLILLLSLAMLRLSLDRLSLLQLRLHLLDHLQPLSTTLIASVVRRLGKPPSLRIIAQQRKRDTTPNRIINRRLVLSEAHANARKPRLDALLTHVRQLAAHNLLVVHRRTAPAALVHRDSRVEDMVRRGLEVHGVEGLLLEKAVAVNGGFAVGHFANVDHGFVEFLGPVLTWKV